MIVKEIYIYIYTKDLVYISFTFKYFTFEQLNISITSLDFSKYWRLEAARAIIRDHKGFKSTTVRLSIRIRDLKTLSSFRADGFGGTPKPSALNEDKFLNPGFKSTTLRLQPAGQTTYPLHLPAIAGRFSGNWLSKQEIKTLTL